MKTKLLLLILLSCTVINVQAQSKFVKTMNEIVQALNQAAGGLQDLTVQTIEVNSISNAYLSHGHTRQVIPIHLPAGTARWYYRITVMNIKSDYSYQSNEAFFYLLKNRQNIPAYQPTTSGVDFFLLGTSGDADSFSQTGNDNFKYYSDYSKLKTNSFIGESPLVQDNLWIGIRNDNKTEGLKVIVEVVAWGHFSK